MGELGLNKIFGAILAAALGVMGLQTLSNSVFSSGEHHGHHGGEEKPYEEAIKDKYAYWTEVAATSSAVVEEGPVYDLGALMLAADAAKGERVFKSVCSSCHTIEQGGADGTGPNLYGIVNRDIASTAGFGYSGALAGVEGDWTYTQLDSWIMDPKNIARGVNMVANVKKDPDRANLIAYLAANTPDAPEFPAPLPEETEEASLEVVTADEAAGDPALATGEVVTVDVVDGDAPNTGDAGEVELGAVIEEELESVAGEIESGAEEIEAAVEETVAEGAEMLEEAETAVEEAADHGDEH